jgi:hypothetical protein
VSAVRARPGLTRAEARTEILQAANRWILRKSRGTGVPGKLLGPRRLQWAVCIVRRRQLVDPYVLYVAGYRMVGER